MIQAKEMASSYVLDRAVMAGAKDVKVMVEAYDGSEAVANPRMLKHYRTGSICARASGDPV